MLVSAFIFGVLAASLALLSELVVLNIGGALRYSAALPNFESLATLALAVAIEEGARYLLVRKYVERFLTGTAPSLSKALLAGGTFGLGFASLELGLLLGSGALGTVPLAPLGGLLLIHVLLSLLYTLSLTRHIRLALLPALMLGLLIHLGYNLALVFLS